MFDRMSPEKLARAKSQAHNTNHLNQLAHTANGFGVSRDEQRKAEAELVRQRGERDSKRRIKDAARKARGSF
jgi:hypothetical protein